MQNEKRANVTGLCNVKQSNNNCVCTVSMVVWLSSLTFRDSEVFGDVRWFNLNVC